MVEKLTRATKQLIPIVLVLLILTISFTIIAYGRGWRVDIQKREVKPTGLISVKSQPSGAQVFVDGKLTTATDNAFNSDPGWFTLRIVKEGYVPWEKKIRIQGEIAIKIETVLFPTNPNLSPLTTTGVTLPTISPDGTKVAYIIPTPSGTLDPHVLKRSGLWSLELSESPLGRNRDPQQLTQVDELLTSPDVTLTWSTDSRQLLVATATLAHLYTIGKPQLYTDVTTSISSLMSDWSVDRITKVSQKLAGFPQDLVNIATSSANILSFSPDETKILYEATASGTIPIIIKPPLIGSNNTTESRTVTTGSIYIYDSKEDKNFLLGECPKLIASCLTEKSKSANQPKKAVVVTSSVLTEIEKFNHSVTKGPVWLPTSNHLVLSQNGKIDIMEYDGTNRVTVYAGPLTDGLLTPWPSGNSLVILTNLNPGASTLPNLYSVNLR